MVLVSAAISPQPSVNAGRIRLFKPCALPLEGRRCRLWEKSSIRRTPSQKFGIDIPSTDSPEMKPSAAFPRFAAASTPRGIERITASISEEKASESVAGKRLK